MSHSFRTAFNGFNKEDVVRYLEYINTKHQNQVNQLHTEIEELRTRLAAKAQPDQALEERCRLLEAQNQQLQEQLDAACAAPEQAAPQEQDSRELDAYRHAEQIRKDAQNQAELVYYQASHVLTEATARLDGAAADITVLADQVMGQLTQLQMAVSAGKQTLQEASSLMNTIRPNR